MRNVEREGEKRGGKEEEGTYEKKTSQEPRGGREVEVENLSILQLKGQLAKRGEDSAKKKRNFGTRSRKYSPRSAQRRGERRWGEQRKEGIDIDILSPEKQKLKKRGGGTRGKKITIGGGMRPCDSAIRGQSIFAPEMLVIETKKRASS